MDTATDQLSLALGRVGGEVIAAWTSAVPKMHATLFHPLLDELLATVQLGFDDIDAIVVGVGPGSYTGVRIAVTAAKAFAHTLGIPVLSVSSLEAAAYAAHAHKGFIVVAWDARRSAAYSAAFHCDPARALWERALPDGRREIAQLAEEVAAIAHGDGVLLLGNAAQALYDALAKTGRGERVTVFDARNFMSGEMLLKLGSDALRQQQNGVRGVKVHGIVPNYSQAAEAQARLSPRIQGE